MTNSNFPYGPIGDMLLSLGYLLFGGWDKLLLALVLFMGADFILFIVYTTSHHKSSLKLYCNSLSHKLLIFLFIAIANILDKQVFNADVVRTPVLLFYIVIEGKTILKTARELGLIIPKVIADAIDKLDKSSEEEIP